MRMPEEKKKGFFEKHHKRIVQVDFVMDLILLVVTGFSIESSGSQLDQCESRCDGFELARNNTLCSYSDSNLVIVWFVFLCLVELDTLYILRKYALKYDESMYQILFGDNDELFTKWEFTSIVSEYVLAGGWSIALGVLSDNAGINQNGCENCSRTSNISCDSGLKTTTIIFIVIGVGKILYGLKVLCKSYSNASVKPNKTMMWLSFIRFWISPIMILLTFCACYNKKTIHRSEDSVAAELGPPSYDEATKTQRRQVVVQDPCFICGMETKTRSQVNCMKFICYLMVFNILAIFCIPTRKEKRCVKGHVQIVKD